MKEVNDSPSPEKNPAADGELSLLSVAGDAKLQPAVDHSGLKLNEIELVQNKPEGNIQEDAERGIRALLSDAIKGDSWSSDSKEAFGRVFDEASHAPRATEQSVADQLNAVGAAINEAVGKGVIGMAIRSDENGTHYYMMLSKDQSALTKNRVDALKGEDTPTLFKVGTFKPGQEI